MTQKKRGPPKPTWAYAYELVPPQTVEVLAPIRALLDLEASNAKLKAETWEARMIRESHVSHILIVSDTPDQGREVNRRIEAALAALEAGFAITLPMEVDDDGGPPDDGPPDDDPPDDEPLALPELLPAVPAK